MKQEFTPIIEQDGEWYIAYCSEIPGANGQGRSKKEANESLSEAISLILQDRLEDASDATRAKLAMKEEGGITLEELSKKYGL